MVEIKEEYQKVLDGLDAKERKDVTEILEAIMLVVAKNNRKKKWENILKVIQDSLKHNYIGWLVRAYEVSFLLMFFLALHDAWGLTAGNLHILNSWFFYNIYLEKLSGHNIFYVLWQIIINAGKFAIDVYIFAWIFSALGFFVLSKIKVKDWDDSRRRMFAYLHHREKYANMKGFSAVTEREEMEKWAMSNPNYHLYGVAINKGKSL